jgi:hypothetical protein
MLYWVGMVGCRDRLRGAALSYITLHPIMGPLRCRQERHVNGSDRTGTRGYGCVAEVRCTQAPPKGP